MKRPRSLYACIEDCTGDLRHVDINVCCAVHYPPRVILAPMLSFLPDGHSASNSPTKPGDGEVFSLPGTTIQGHSLAGGSVSSGRISPFLREEYPTLAQAMQQAQSSPPGRRSTGAGVSSPKKSSSFSPPRKPATSTTGGRGKLSVVL